MSLTDLDVYVGVSSGAFVVAGLANGISPSEMNAIFILDRPHHDPFEPGLLLRPAFRRQSMLARTGESEGATEGCGSLLPWHWPCARFARIQLIEPLASIPPQRLVTGYSLGEQQSLDPIDVLDPLVCQRLAFTAKSAAVFLLWSRRPVRRPRNRTITAHRLRRSSGKTYPEALDEIGHAAQIHVEFVPRRVFACPAHRSAVRHRAPESSFRSRPAK